MGNSQEAKLHSRSVIEEAIDQSTYLKEENLAGFELFISLAISGTSSSSLAQRRLEH